MNDNTNRYDLAFSTGMYARLECLGGENCLNVQQHKNQHSLQQGANRIERIAGINKSGWAYQIQAPNLANVVKPNKFYVQQATIGFNTINLQASFTYITKLAGIILSIQTSISNIVMRYPITTMVQP